MPSDEHVSKQLRYLCKLLETHADVRSVSVHNGSLYIRFNKHKRWNDAIRRELKYHEYMQRSLAQLNVPKLVSTVTHLTTDWHICRYDFHPERAV